MNCPINEISHKHNDSDDKQINKKHDFLRKNSKQNIFNKKSKVVESIATKNRVGTKLLQNYSINSANASLSHGNTMLPNKHDICVCPELYSAYRSEELVCELSNPAFSLKKYSKGRIQVQYPDETIEVMYNDIKLTRWSNGDFKLIEGDKVSYWNEQLCEIDQYYLS